MSNPSLESLSQNFDRFDDTYKTLITKILNDGYQRNDRTGVGCRSIFGWGYSVDVTVDFPLLTLREISWQVCVHELIWFLMGTEDISYLHEHGIRMWDPWAEDGQIKKGYGYQWRRWGDDQIARLVSGLMTNPDGRRHVVSAWNAGELDEMSLPPCHMFFQCSVRGDTLDLLLYQRSCDVVIGLPYNAAEYATLLQLLAAACGYQAGRFTHFIGDAHIYNNLIEEAHELRARQPSLLPPYLTISREISPQDIIRPSIKPTDFCLSSYYPSAKMELRDKVAI